LRRVSIVVRQVKQAERGASGEDPFPLYRKGLDHVAAVEGEEVDAKQELTKFFFRLD
jgi:hypothetical protein